METNARAAYLETQILTATPQRLRLLLIDGAIRFANETAGHWKEDRVEPGRQSLERCRAVISELLAAVKADRSELTQQVAGIYAFLFRELTEANVDRNIDKLADVVRVLHVERETWSELCDNMPEAPKRAEPVEPEEISASGLGSIPAAPSQSTGAPLAPPAPTGFDSADFSANPSDAATTSGGGLSLDA